MFRVSMKTEHEDGVRFAVCFPVTRSHKVEQLLYGVVMVQPWMMHHWDKFEKYLPCAYAYPPLQDLLIEESDLKYQNHIFQDMNITDKETEIRKNMFLVMPEGYFIMLDIISKLVFCVEACPYLHLDSDLKPALSLRLPISCKKATFFTPFMVSGDKPVTHEYIHIFISLNEKINVTLDQVLKKSVPALKFSLSFFDNLNAQTDEKSKLAVIHLGQEMFENKANMNQRPRCPYIHSCANAVIHPEFDHLKNTSYLTKRLCCCESVSHPRHADLCSKRLQNISNFAQKNSPLKIGPYIYDTLLNTVSTSEPRQQRCDIAKNSKMPDLSWLDEYEKDTCKPVLLKKKKGKLKKRKPKSPVRKTTTLPSGRRSAQTTLVTRENTMTWSKIVNAKTTSLSPPPPPPQLRPIIQQPNPESKTTKEASTPRQKESTHNRKEQRNTILEPSVTPSPRNTNYEHKKAANTVEHSSIVPHDFQQNFGLTLCTTDHQVDSSINIGVTRIDFDNRRKILATVAHAIEYCLCNPQFPQCSMCFEATCKTLQLFNMEYKNHLNMLVCQCQQCIGVYAFKEFVETRGYVMADQRMMFATPIVVTIGKGSKAMQFLYRTIKSNYGWYRK